MFSALDFCRAAPLEPEAEEVPAPPQLQLRTASDEAVAADRALELLRAGNARFVADCTKGSKESREQSTQRRALLSTDGQNPAAVVIACADSRCPVEILFDAQPGDLFVLRNAGNTCTHAEGSIVGSVEYACGHLGTRLVLVLGHTLCGAIAGATKVVAARKAAPAPCEHGDGAPRPQPKKQQTMLDTMLVGLAPAAEAANSELPEGATQEQVAAHAVRVNVFHTMEKLLEYSEPLRKKVREGAVELHGGIYDLHTGSVEFLGPSPKTAELLESHPAFA